MTSALRIFSNRAVSRAGIPVLAFALGLPAVASTVSGSVDLMNSQDPLVRKHKDYSGVVVWLEALNGTALRAVSGESKSAQMIQKNKRFTPHVLAIPVGSAVSFPNFDPIFHNAFSNFNGQIFDVGLYKPGSSRTVEFKREGFVRARIDGEIIELDRPEPIRLKKDERHNIDAVVDRLVVREGIRVRLTDSVETALKWGQGVLLTLHELPEEQSRVLSLKSKV